MYHFLKYQITNNFQQSFDSIDVYLYSPTLPLISSVFIVYATTRKVINKCNKTFNLSINIFAINLNYFRFSFFLYFLMRQYLLQFEYICIFAAAAYPIFNVGRVFYKQYSDCISSLIHNLHTHTGVCACVYFGTHTYIHTKWPENKPKSAMQ